MERKWLEMIEAFLRLTPEERAAEAEKRLDETLERMAQIYNISQGEAYAKLVENRDRNLSKILTEGRRSPRSKEEGILETLDRRDRT